MKYREWLKDPTNYTKISKTIIESPELTAHEVRLWIALAGFAYQKGSTITQIEPSRERLRQIMGMKSSTGITRLIKSLKQKGYLEVKKRVGKRNIYELIVPKSICTQCIEGICTECVGGICTESNTKKEEKRIKEKKSLSPSKGSEPGRVERTLKTFYETFGDAEPTKRDLDAVAKAVNKYSDEELSDIIDYYLYDYRFKSEKNPFPRYCFNEDTLTKYKTSK